MSNNREPFNVAVLDDYQNVALSMADWTALKGRAALTVFNDHIADVDAVVSRLLPFDIVCVMRERTPMTRAVIERLPRLRLIASTALRNASIDGNAAEERGIQVVHTGYTSAPTIELTWALILAGARHLVEENMSLRAGGWQRFIGEDLGGRKLGVLGLGNIGSAVARIGKAFGMTVIAWSQNLTADRAAAVGAELVSKDELFRQADVVSIHLVLSGRTRGLVGAAELALMKPTARLVNTSRGPIVVETNLLEALQSGTIAGAAVDVFDQEPLPPDHPFRSLPNLLATPHIGYVSRGLYQRFYQDTVDNIAKWIDGQANTARGPGSARGRNERREVEFAVDGGDRIRGWLFLPSKRTGRLPAISLAHGYAGVKEHGLESFARAFGETGFVALVHDHRNFGASDGALRHDIDPWRQIADWRRAISFLESLPEVDATRIGVWGTSYAGGHVLVLGATDRRIRAVVSQVPTISGYEQGLRRVPPDAVAALEHQFDEDERAQLRGEPPRLQQVVNADASVAASYRTADAIAFYLQPLPEGVWKNEVTIRSGRLARMYEPGHWAARVAPTPLLMIVALADNITLTDLQLRAYEQMLEPKKFATVEGGHFDPYLKQFPRASAAAVSWFREHLAADSPEPR